MYSKGDLKGGEGVRMDEDSQSVKIGKSECGWWKREKSVRGGRRGVGGQGGKANLVV